MSKTLLGNDPGSQGVTTLSDGSEAAMPLLTYAARTFAAVYTINARKARALLPPSELRPVLVSPRRALLVVQAMEYTDKTTEPYREFGVSIPVHRSPRADLPFLSTALWPRLPLQGNYITHLAVDTREALLIGREILGFPKVVADIELLSTDTDRVIEAAVDGQPAFSLSVRRPRKSPKAVRRNFYCYSLSPIDNLLYQVPYQSEASAAVTLGPRAARLHLGSHPIADEIRDLDISAAPLLAVDIPQYSMVSNRPEAKIDVGQWRDPRHFYHDWRAAHPPITTPPTTPSPVSN